MFYDLVYISYERTNYSEIGQFEPNRHTAPHTYHGLNTRCIHEKPFTCHLYKS